jgi:hypothetical protein
MYVVTKILITFNLLVHTIVKTDILNIVALASVNFSLHVALNEIGTLSKLKLHDLFGSSLTCSFISRRGFKPFSFAII